MFRKLTLTTALATALTLPAYALAQSAPSSGMQMQGGQMSHQMHSGQTGAMDHGAMNDEGMPGTGMMHAMPGEMAQMPGMDEMMRGMMKMMQAMQGGRGAGSGAGAAQGVGGSPLSEPGQSAFAAIAEAVAALEADPATDWSKVNIRALRDHLRDMDLVTIWSDATAEDIPGGQVFTVTGDARIAPAIQRMVGAHARVMNGVDGWQYGAEMIEGGARLTVTVPEGDLPRLKALGFYGILASGMHHQPHHWMMATGGNPHH